MKTDMVFTSEKCKECKGKGYIVTKPFANPLEDLCLPCERCKGYGLEPKVE